MADLQIDEAALQLDVMGKLEIFATGFVSTVVPVAKGLAPRQTGRLANSIKADSVVRTGPWSLSTGISATAPYAAPVHEGARPHVIRAKNARALRFYWPKVGAVVFFKKVNHPGNRANPFLSNAVHRVVSADPRIDNSGL